VCFVLAKLTINSVFLSHATLQNRKGVLFFVLVEEKAQNLSKSMRECVQKSDMLPLSLTAHTFVQHKCVFIPPHHWWSTVGSSVTGILHVLQDHKTTFDCLDMHLADL